MADLTQTLVRHATRAARNSTIIRRVSRAALELHGEGAFEKVIREAAAWMKARNVAVPDQAFDAQPFSIGGGGHPPAEALLLDLGRGRLWAARLDDPDDRVPERTWITEITVGERDDRVAFGARLLCGIRGEAHFTPSRPGIVRQIIQKLDARMDGRQITESHIDVTSDTFPEFYSLLTRSSRALPIVAVSATDAGHVLVDPTALCKQLSGVAHVAVLDNDASWSLTDYLGKASSVFGGAARIYRPDFDPNGDPYEQPLWFPRRVSPESEVYSLPLEPMVKYAFGSTNRSRHLPTYPSFDELRSIASERRSRAARNAGQSDRDLLALAEDEIAQLRDRLATQKAEYDDHFNELDAEREQAERVAEQSRADASALRTRVVLLEAALRARGGGAIDQPLSRLEDIRDWAEHHLAGSLWIASKAIKETEKAVFAEPQRLGDTLLMLRDFYVPMRRNADPALRQAYEEALAARQLIDAPCFKNRNDIKGYPEYSCVFGGEKLWCYDHIKYRASYDPTEMFRIYYHWHEDEQILLIGHMPTHLDNNRTN